MRLLERNRILKSADPQHFRHDSASTFQPGSNTHTDPIKSGQGSAKPNYESNSVADYFASTTITPPNGTLLKLRRSPSQNSCASQIFFRNVLWKNQISPRRELFYRVRGRIQRARTNSHVQDW